ncbi:MAG: hypothetical protein HFH62_15040 [Lachnospiraceae bacterium]|nr:hypothetical protein [Lachnospiraceae bacterium]
MDAAMNLKEQPDIKTLLYVLGSSGLKKEQQEVETLVDYLESMGNQFSQMIGELQAMREELEKMQDKGIRTTVSRVLEGAENKTQEIWGKVSMIGKNLIQSAKNALAVFREKGVNALRRAVSAMKIPQVLSAVKGMMHHRVKKMNEKLEKTQMLAQELHKAKEHRRNVGRILAGRGAKEPTGQAADRGILVKVQKVFLTCGKMYAGMERMADTALQRVEQFCRGAEKKTSVKADLKQLRNQKPEQRSIPSVKKEQSR